jgi:hypothetical protein
MGKLPRKIQRAWKSARNLFKPSFDSALATFESTNDELTLLNAELALYALPAHVLLHLTGNKLHPYSTSLDLDDGTSIPCQAWRAAKNHSIPSPAADPNDVSLSQQGHQAAIHAARKAMYRGKPKLARTLLASNGTAKRDIETAKILRDMHPKPRSPISQPIPVVGTIVITPAQAAAFVRKTATSTSIGPDFFGWSPDLNLVDCGERGTTLIDSIGRLISLKASAKVPTSSAFLGTAGGLAALNKVSESLQQELRANGERPKIRPANAGSWVTKSAFQLIIASESGKRVAEGLEGQLGVGVKCGPEILAHIARIAYEAGFIITSEDAVNAFNEFSRNAMLHKIAEIWPEAYACFYLHYAQDSLALFAFSDTSGAERFAAIKSSEGSRMGCPGGQIGFCITMNDVYVQCRRKFQDIEQFALTDDFPGFVPPPRGRDGQPPTAQDWHSTYLQIRDRNIYYDSLANPLGIYRSATKGTLLLPHSAPLPAQELLTGPFALRSTYEGVIIAGAAVGCPSFVLKHAHEKVDHAAARIEAITQIADEDPQMAIMLLGSSANAALGYFVRVTPMVLAAQAIERFDNLMIQARFRSLLPDGHAAPTCSDERLAVSNMIATLPAECGGLGHIPLALRAPPAYIASLMKAQSNTFVSANATKLDFFVQSAYDAICTHLGVPFIPLDHPLSAVLPPSAMQINRPGFLDSQNTFPRNTQSVITRCMLETSKHALQDWAQRSQDKSLATHLLSILSRSQASRIVRCDLWYRANRIPKHLAVAYLRYYTCLPALLYHREGTVPVGDHYVQAQCARCKAEGKIAFLDAHGNHAASCMSTRLARSICHTDLCKTARNLALETGSVYQHEPPTAALLNGHYSTAACRSMFSKKATVKSRERGANLLSLFNLLETADPQDIPAYTASIDMLLSEDTDDNNGGLRLDGAMDTSPLAELWLDFTSIHPTATTYLQANHSWFLNELKAALASRNTGASNEFMLCASKAVENAIKAKTIKYSLLTAIGVSQYHAGRRSRAPEFEACVMSHLGEMSPGFFKLIEALVASARRSPLFDPSETGLSLSKSAAAFRTRAKDHFAVANAIGFGRMLLAAGSVW